MSIKRWYAVNVRPNHEYAIAIALHNKGYEVFLPSYRCRSEWSDRIKEVSRPLFPGYVFCRFDLDTRTALIITTPGVIRIVGFGSKPVPIEESEIAAVRKILESGYEAKPSLHFQPDSRVRITSGVLAGTEGVLIQVKNRNQFVVSISLLQRSVAVHIDRTAVDSLEPCALAHGLALSEE